MICYQRYRSSNESSLQGVGMRGDAMEAFTFEKASSHSVFHSNLSFFFRVENKKEGFAAHTREEARHGSEATCKLMHFIEVCGVSHGDDFLKFIRIDLNAFLY